MNLKTMLFTSMIILEQFSNCVLSCDCFVTSAAEAVERSDAVFVGRVTAIDRQTPETIDLAINFLVTNSWKGVQGTELGLRSEGSGTSCDLSVTLGDTLLIYAQEREGKSGLYVSPCSRTRPLTGEIEDLAEFDELGLSEIVLEEGPDLAYPPIAFSEVVSDPLGPTCRCGEGLSLLCAGTLSFFFLLNRKRGY